MKYELNLKKIDKLTIQLLFKILKYVNTAEEVSVMSFSNSTRDSNSCIRVKILFYDFQTVTEFELKKERFLFFVITLLCGW